MFNKHARFTFQILLAVVVVAHSLRLRAMLSAPLKVKPGQIVHASRAGFINGGVAGEEFSLLKIENQVAGQSETLSLAYGDRQGKQIRGLPGFYQIALDRDGRRLVIDLAQVDRTAVDPQSLRQKLKSSPLVSSVDMTMDPQDRSTNITLNLKEPIEISVVSTGPSEPSAVSIAMKPASSRKGAK